MPAPINTYDSNTELALGNVPDIDDPVLYEALLDIHNAIEAILTSSDAGDAVFTAFIAKFRNVTVVSADYNVLATDGLVLVDITAGNVTITLPTGADFAGYKFEIKAIADSLPSTNECLIVGEGGAPVDEDAGGITIDALEALPVKYDLVNNKYWIDN
jgi:hypothetical protein